MRYYPPRLTASLAGDWQRAAGPAGGTVSIHLRSLDAPVAGRLDYTAHYAASTVKLAIGVAALAEIDARRADPRQALAVHDVFPTAARRSFQLHRADDNDEATWDRLGQSEQLGVLLERMIVHSSNIAANLITQRVTLAAVARVLSTAPTPGVTMHHLFGDCRARESTQRNAVTAAGLCRLLAALARGRLLSAESTDALIALLARQTNRRMIPTGLPDGTWSAGKPGWVEGVAHDVQLVRPPGAPEYILAVCTSTGLGDDAEALIARISRITSRHWTTWHTS